MVLLAQLPELRDDAAVGGFLGTTGLLVCQAQCSQLRLGLSSALLRIGHAQPSQRGLHASQRGLHATWMAWWCEAGLLLYGKSVVDPRLLYRW